MPQYRVIPNGEKCHSEVASVGCRTLCVTVPELVACGVSEVTIKVGLMRTRTGEAYCWPHHKEGNVVYVHYDGLKERYQRLIDAVHCGGVEANAHTTSQEAQKRQNELTAVCSTLPAMVEVSAADQANGFVRFPKAISSIRVLDRKAREFASTGLNLLIGGYFGNANRERIDTVIHAVLMDLASSPLKYSFEDISMLYNTMPEYAHLERMTTSAIKQHLNQPKHRKVWMYCRHGKQVGDDLYQPQAQRETPANPDDLWSIDGTTAQLYYRDGEGKIKSDLYMYFVTDASTGAIIGHSIAYTEVTGLVVEALQDAVVKHGYCPKQIQYDNSSANVTDMVKGLMRNMSRVHFPCKPYLGRAKYVEEIIGHFQQRVLRQQKNFKGGNVTTQSLNSKANPELLKWLKKNPEQLPTENEAIAQLQQAVEAWNTRGERRDNYGRWVGKSKIGRYAEPADDRKVLNYFDKLSLFMVELSKPYKYRQQGIRITISGKKYNFIVPDPDNSANDFLFANENLYREFRVRVNVNNPQFIELFDKNTGRPVAQAIEKEKFAAAVANMGAGSRVKITDFLRKQEQYGYEYAFRELKAQRATLAANGVKATGTGDFFGECHSDKRGQYFGWQEAPKSDWNRIEGELEDQLNGLADRETPTGRAVRDLGSAMGKM